MREVAERQIITIPVEFREKPNENSTPLWIFFSRATGAGAAADTLAQKH